jgi:hypothetical protein
MAMPQAIARGMSASAFLSKIRFTTGGYQKQRFLADWRSVAGIEKRKDAFKFVRRDRRPPMKAIADVEWPLEKEYMYKVRAFVRTSPGEPLTERFVNIQSDKPLSPDEIERETERLWDDTGNYADETLERVQAFAGYHRIEGPDFEE